MSRTKLTLAELQPHQQRVVVEFKVLCTRVESLRAFMHTEKFKKLNVIEQSLLRTQIQAMNDYASALDDRLNLWGVLV
jgi:hypothetical protein